MLATSYPLLDAFLTILYFFLWIIWIFILIRVIFDIFRSRDLHGWGKAGWFVFVIILPFLGVLVYLIVRGGTMHEREVQRAQTDQQAFDDYVRRTAGSSTSPADQLAKLAQLHDQGHLSDEEFQAEKTKILSS